MSEPADYTVLETASGKIVTRKPQRFCRRCGGKLRGLRNRNSCHCKTPLLYAPAAPLPAPGPDTGKQHRTLKPTSGTPSWLTPGSYYLRPEDFSATPLALTPELPKKDQP